MPLSVSIAMATFNGERYIAEQLESLSQQTILPSELVVTDDGSTDNTVAIVSDFATRASFPVRLERNAERLGYRANFIKAAGLCGSNVIAFCDQDDVWLPTKLEKCLPAFDKKETLLAYHNATAVTENLSPIGNLDNRAAPRTLNKPNTLSPWLYGLGFTLLFRRELLAFSDLWPQSSDFHRANEKEAHDEWFFFLASASGNIAYIPEPLVLYRQHAANAYGWKANKNRAKHLLLNISAAVSEGFSMRAQAAGSRAAILEQIQNMVDGSLRDNATKAAAGYRRLEQNYRQRLGLYSRNNRLMKFGCLLNLLQHGGYRPLSQWGVGPKAFGRDLFRGILFPERDAA